MTSAPGKDIKHQFLYEQPIGKRKDSHAILAERACFTPTQISKLQKNVQAVVGKMYKQPLQKGY